MTLTFDTIFRMSKKVLNYADCPRRSCSPERDRDNTLGDCLWLLNSATLAASLSSLSSLPHSFPSLPLWFPFSAVAFQLSALSCPDPESSSAIVAISLDCLRAEFMARLYANEAWNSPARVGEEGARIRGREGWTAPGHGPLSVVWLSCWPTDASIK